MKESLKPAAKPRKNARHRSREFTVQGLYQWQLAGTPIEAIESEWVDAQGFDKADRTYLQTLLRGTIAHASTLEDALRPHLDRAVKELSPIERGILLLGAYEFIHRPEVPYRVVINEAVELAKTFGGTDGHKYVNGVLDKLAAVARSTEVEARRRS